MIFGGPEVDNFFVGSGLGMYNQGIGIIFPTKSKGFPLRNSRQICSEVHLMVIGGYFL